ncbi:glycosyltransferase family 2 protein [Georgenia deserti]|uniref:Glycosyltransferase family 2 protein n=1 Tax=Georgenia deserti TaxID=2093781 RepID=A0ABW4L138_9MICO
MPTRPTTLAVVVSTGVTAYLPRTLAAIAAQTHSPEVVLVVDVGAPGRDVGTGVPVHEAVAEAGLEDLARVRVVRAPEASTFGQAVTLGLAGYAELVERAARRARKREATGWSGVTGELNPVTTGEMRAVGAGGGAPDAGAAAEWLWLLHDDSAPAPEALDRLLHAAESGRSIALLGAKQCDWDEPDRLLEVGVRATRSARRVPEIEPGEIDQGQHDHREDVLAVGLAGALVRRTVWDELDGPDPALGPFGDGLELSRRARLAGHRVVVVPTAVVHHARAAFHGLRGGGLITGDASEPDPRRSFLPRRRAQLFNALLTVPGLAVPFVAVWFLLLGALRALWRVTTKEIGLAGAELGAPLAVLGRTDELWRARRRHRGSRRLSRRAALVPLEAKPAEIRRARRDVRRTQAAARRAVAAPSELEIAERAALARRRRVTGTLTAVVLTAVALIAFIDLLLAGPLTGAALRPLDVTAGQLWTMARSGWVVGGDGHPGPADPLLQVLAVPAALVAPFGASANAVITAILLGSIPLAGLGAWFAAGAATRSVGLRAVATVTWALSPALLLATGQGRLGPVLAHLLLPWAGLGLARAVAVDRRDVVLSGLVGARRTERARAAEERAVADGRTVSPQGVETTRRTRAGSIAAGAGAALALAAACAGVPALLPAAVVVAVVLAVLAPRRRLVLLLVPVPALVLLGPSVLAAVANLPGGSWRILFGGGVPYPAGGAGASPSWLPLLGWPVEPVTFPGLDPEASGVVGAAAEYGMLAGGATLLLGAVLALARGTGRARAVRAGWLVALVGLVLALLAVRTDVGVGTGADGTSQVVRAWAGPGVSLVVLGLLVAVVSAGDGLRAALAGRSFGWRQVTTTVLALLVVAGPLATGAGWLVGVTATPSDRPGELLAVHGREAPPVPAVAEEMQTSSSRSRVLALVPSGGTIQAQIWRGAGPQLTDSAAVADLAELEREGFDDADRELAGLVAAISVGAADDVGQVLGAHAVGVVVVPHEPTFVPAGTEPTTTERAALLERLDATAGLERVTENESGAIWRVSTTGGAGSAPSVARARIHDADGEWTGDLPAGTVGMRTEVAAGEQGRTLVLAERADNGWRAWYDGEPLRATTEGWRQAFELPPDAGTLQVSYQAAPTIWTWVQAVVLGLTLLLALPVRRRRTEVDS